jgi:hypothetical protein
MLQDLQHNGKILNRFIAGQKYNIRPSVNSHAVHEVPLYGLKVTIQYVVTTHKNQTAHVYKGKHYDCLIHSYTSI